ncbi:hypothetical protein [Rhodoferax aquaticus]|uniref:DUF3102 domain-containing protein n=1 Tax=Rhodoferax aquaticus TaxID=2527691 RepID=A0A515ETB0_9BURK|nr:hypothetical protein [Rhodoferax aquaticus]QDL55917.1 hypothetical protein EXZ61_18010 [Rhodoferax aquaticus]
MMAKKNEVAINGENGGAGRDLLNQLLGQAQALNAAGEFLRTFGVSKIAIVKENKLYQQLSGMSTPNGSELRGTWQEFCGLLGVSVDKADEDIKNVKAFGENALEMMTRIGIGYRELRQFRRLPDDEQKALVEVASTGDKDALIDFAEAVIARHAREKAVLKQEVEDLAAHNTDLGTQRDKAQNDLKAMEKKVRRAARDEEDMVVPLVVADVRAELAALIKKAELAVTSLHPIGVEVVGLVSHADAAEWVEPTLRLGLSGLLAVRELVDGSIKSFAEAMGDSAKRLRSQPDTLSFLDASEIKSVAEEWARLTAVHQHEAALREHERAQAKPRGKGRPAKAPDAPKA